MILGDGLFQCGAVEIRPVGWNEHQFTIGRLPEQEIRQPLFAAGANDEIGIGDVGRIEILMIAASATVLFGIVT